MYCTKCGVYLDKMETVCPQCGAVLQKIQPAEPEANLEAEPKENLEANPEPEIIPEASPEAEKVYAATEKPAYTANVPPPSKKSDSPGGRLMEGAWRRFMRLPRRGKEAVAIAAALVVFVLGCLAHSAVSIKNEDYQAAVTAKEQLLAEKNQLAVELSQETKQYQEYKAKMEPYEEIQLTDAQNKAEAERLRLEQEAKAAAEQKAAEEAAAAEKAAAEKAAAEKAAAEAAAAKAAEEARGYETGITYDQLARTPDNYKGQKVKFKGKVIQVIEGDSETQLRLAVNGDYDAVLYCSVPKEKTANTRILENDYITIMGKSAGLLSYKSTLGGTITIPAVLVDDWGPN